MDKHWVEEVFERCGALLSGHFVLTSGRHSGKYLDKTMVSPDGQEIADICFEMASEIGSRFPEIEVVVGPAEVGIIIAHEVAKSLTEFYQRKVYSAFTEKDAVKKQILKRFKNLVYGRRVLVVDDVMTTGSSVKKIINEVHKAGGIVVAVGVICNRGGASLDYPLFSFWQTEIEDWLPEKCPLCRDGIPINKEFGGNHCGPVSRRPHRDTDSSGRPFRNCRAPRRSRGCPWPSVNRPANTRAGATAIGGWQAASR